jgi:hypothetical protein
MASWPPVGDEDLLAEVGAALRAPAPPEDHLHAAKGAYAWRTVDAELAIAELTFDSACDAEPAGLTRSVAGTGDAARSLTYRSGPVVVDIDVSPDGNVGQLKPASGGRVTAGTHDGVYDRTQVGPVGFFTLAAPPAGPVRICAYTAGYSVATSWVSLT